MIRVGIAGWDYPDWEGVVYPTPHPHRFDKLPFLAGYLDVVEINMTFYHQPDAAATAGWARRVAGSPEVRFTVKLIRDLTHIDLPREGQAAQTDDALQREADRFRKGVEPLAAAGRLAAVLAQFPHRFHDRDESRRHL